MFGKNYRYQNGIRVSDTVADLAESKRPRLLKAWTGWGLLKPG